MLPHAQSTLQCCVATPQRRWWVACIWCLVGGFVLFSSAPHLTHAQQLSIEEDPTIAPLIVRGQGEAVALTFYSSLVNLSFGSNLIGNNRGILSNRSQPADGRYILLVSPESQVITVRANGYEPETLRLHRYRAQEGRQWAYRVEPVAGRQQTGSLTIKTDPQGADLRIEGFPNLPMRTPYELSDFPAGTYAISLSLAGHETLETQVTVEASSTQNVTYVLTLVNTAPSPRRTTTPQQPAQPRPTATTPTIARAAIEDQALLIEFSRREGETKDVRSSFDPDANIIVVELETTQFRPIQDALEASGLFADVAWKRRAISRSQRRQQNERSVLWLYPRSDLTLVRGKLWEYDDVYRFTFALTGDQEASLPITQNRSERLSPALQAADADWRAGRTEAAITKLEAILRTDPRNKAALLRLGDAYFIANRYSQAASQYATLVDTDPAWAYPEARVKRCSALLEATYALSSACARHLDGYLSRESNGRYRAQAQHLLSLHRTPTEAELLSTRRDIRVFMQERLVANAKNLIYIWETECVSCVSDLQRLYAYAAQHPDVRVSVVSIDRMRDHRVVNERLTYTFADFRERNLRNVQFFHDADRQLERNLVPSAQRSSIVPRTLFLRGDKVNVVWNGMVAWDSPRVTAAWEPTTTPGW